MTQTVLLVDDDPHIREVVEYALKKAGFSVITAGDGRKGLETFESSSPDIIVLDIEMPELDGAEVCKAVRSKSAVPIIFLTCRDEEIDRVLGLEIGGDDYVVKPFSARELVARVRAVLRRAAPSVEPDESKGLLSRGELRLDLDRCRAYWKDGEISLSATEFRILQALMARPGRVYSREELMEKAEVNSERAVDSHVKRIRRKFETLGAAPLETVHGFGYRISL